MSSFVDLEHGDATGRFVFLLLYQLHQDRATELIIGISSSSSVPMRCKAEGTWRELPPIPSGIRHAVVSELARLANFNAGQIPGKGVLDVSLGPIRFRWVVAMTSADGECTLKRVAD
jgi:hypothetical protein